METSKDLDARAREILRRNDRGAYTVPTADLYPHQWNWDSAFAALGLATFDLDRAWTEFETLLAGQWGSGMVPHILFHERDTDYFPGPEVWDSPGDIPSSGISQPPVAATLVRRIWERDRVGYEDRMRALFPKLAAWHGWFMEWRLDRGAVCITHPWEAGRDNAPDWDEAMSRINPHGVNGYVRHDTKCVDPDMRPTKLDYDRYIWLVDRGREVNWDEGERQKNCDFRVADPTMTFILLRANLDLTAIGYRLGEDTSALEEWTGILADGAETLWNPSLACFDSRDANSGAWANCVSNASFLCWYAGIHRDEMRRHYDRVTSSVAYGIPSHDPDSSKFDPQRYWRGPVWPVINTLAGIGMAESGLKREAGAVREFTSELIRRNGFFEYYNPCDGSPAGGRDFTWTAAIWLAWASQGAGDDKWA
ncbi:MAG: hypothetical protein OXC26_19100 [Albidovulum sp.]|nr:hypothetical protein [Albidovulum sp.]